MTLGEALTAVLDTINGISVPVMLHQQIGVPLHNAAELLAECVMLVRKDEEEHGGVRNEE